MLRQQMKRFALIRSVHARMRAAAERLRRARRRSAQQVLTIGLVAVYFLLVTPVGIVRRALLGRSLAHPSPRGNLGWRSIRQSSADKHIYLSEY